MNVPRSPAHPGPSTHARDDKTFRIAIIGSGFGGLGTAIRLRQEGVTDFVVLERASDVGGTWRDNTYPGCACDVESHLYSFSFAPNPEWTHRYSPQPEIQTYLQNCARDFGVLPHIRFDHDVLSASWNEEARQWQIETSHGTFTASFLVAASGPLSAPMQPAGFERFAGKTFHSSRWDHAYDLTGKHVAVIGTGASAIQFVPQIQPRVAKLTLFQRTPAWVLPRFDGPIPPRRRRLFKRIPLLQRVARALIYLYRELTLVLFRHPRMMRRTRRLALWHMKRGIADAALRAKLTPGYVMGCKRILLSNDYYPALAQPNVDVVTEPIAEVREHSIVTADGVEHAIDTIIFGTGFHPTTPPIATIIRGRNGSTVADLWAGSPRAHLGTTIAGLPNFFMLLGPNTGTGHTSVVYVAEQQIEHFLNALRYMEQRGMQTLEPRADAQAEFVGHVDRRMRATVWVAGGCASWYLDATGRNSTLWPDLTWRYARRVTPFDPKEYVLA